MCMWTGRSIFPVRDVNSKQYLYAFANLNWNVYADLPGLGSSNSSINYLATRCLDSHGISCGRWHNQAMDIGRH
eukprot:1604017-Pyramimonas_sp.AAC.1